MPDINSLVYRGYPVQDLADHCSFEEVAYLLWHNDLPSKSELEAFKSYVSNISGDERTIAAQLGEAKSLLAYAALSLPCVREAGNKNKILDETLRAINKVSVAKGISILKDLGLWNPARPITDRRF
jgi:citrate synthase